ncbi:hypothetical protein [Staphylococcus aureus]|uniref:hypothetical protein n=1 Tax=Staphylococcus aureus TaxID=1280 RepID=UPI00177E68A7|nr:hypothetical protein [Staphylococcus aureus]
MAVVIIFVYGNIKTPIAPEIPPTIEERHSNAYQKGTLFVRSVSALTYHQYN